MRVDRERIVAAFACLLLATAALGVASPAAVLAQESPESAGAERAQSFEAVEGAVQEDVPGGPLTVIAYGLIWLFLLLYVVRLARQQQRTEAEVQRLERVLSKPPADSG